jgi:hypothetical protein
MAELERRYDGPVPEALRRAARVGALAAYLESAGQTAFFAAMVRGQIATIRRRRADGTVYPALFADLALYRREWRRWRQRHRTLDASNAAAPRPRKAGALGEI